MPPKNSKEALLQWCKNNTVGYDDVRIVDFSMSWQDVHRFRPDKIDFSSLQKENKADNLKIAFDALESLGVPRLLDVEDMLIVPRPEPLSVTTYVSEIYHKFKKQEPSAADQTPYGERPQLQVDTTEESPVITKPLPQPQPKSTKTAEPVQTVSKSTEPPASQAVQPPAQPTQPPASKPAPQPAASSVPQASSANNNNKERTSTASNRPSPALDFVNNLVATGRDVNLPTTEFSRTPLFAVSSSSQHEAILVLLKNGASITALDTQKNTPLDVCIPEVKNFILENLQSPQQWIPDQTFDKCQICRETEFGFFTRRHHCRHCGRLCCAECSNYRTKIPSFGFDDEVRVCKECYGPIQTSNKHSQPKAN